MSNLVYNEGPDMKIVLIDKEEGLKVGGMLVYTERFHDYLVRQGHEVSILRYQKKTSKRKNIHKIPYYWAEARTFVVLPTEKSLAVIRKYLETLKPDIVYFAFGLSPLDFFLPKICQKLKIPLTGVWHADMNDSGTSYQLVTKSIFLSYLPICRNISLIHVFSKKMKDFYENLGVKRENILVLPNGVNPKVYAPGSSSFAKKNNIRNGILFLGRLTTLKNPRILIESFLKIDPPDDTKLILVGDGEERSILEESFKDKRIIFTGLIQNESEKIDILRGCRMFVLPSKFEGMSLALLEAMSVKLACIASDAGSSAEIIGKSGIVIPTNNLKYQLPLAMKICLDHPDLMNNLGIKARNRIKNSFSEERNFSTLEDRLLNVITKYRVRKEYTRTFSDQLIPSKARLKILFKKARALTAYI